MEHRKTVIIVIALFLGLSVSLAQPCGKLNRQIIFTSLDWPSAQLNNAIARYIFEVGFYCDTAEVSGSALPLTQQLAIGTVDISMEVWVDNAPKVYFEGVQNGTVVQLSEVLQGLEGFFVPRYVIYGDAMRGIKAMAPALDEVTDLVNYAGVFATASSAQKGVFHNCVVGWKCEYINDYKLEAYGLKPYFINYKMESGLDLEEAIAESYEKGVPFLTYYWTPTWILGEYDMIQLKEPAFDEGVWKRMKESLEKQDGSAPKQAVAYPEKTVYIAITKEMYDSLPPELISFLQNYHLEDEIISHYLAKMHNEKPDQSVLAKTFLKEQEKLWTPWLPPDIVHRIQNSYR
ncbi:MAG: hypothetical protein KC422_15580 [Trueperaceae bacterium]|nr:hypothetical protein [Trueperaceae bacterium]